jgi:hypothetical protein
MPLQDIRKSSPLWQLLSHLSRLLHLYLSIYFFKRFVYNGRRTKDFSRLTRPHYPLPSFVKDALLYYPAAAFDSALLLAPLLQPVQEPAIGHLAALEAGTRAHPLRLTARTCAPCAASACTRACPTLPVAPNTTCKSVGMAIFPHGFLSQVYELIIHRKYQRPPYVARFLFIPPVLSRSQVSRIGS